MSTRLRAPGIVVVTAGLALLLAAPSASADKFPWDRFSTYPDSWYNSIEAKFIATNVVSHQSQAGGWPKDIDTGAVRFEGDRKTLQGTFEDGATLGELRFLARLSRVDADQRHIEALEKGLKYVLDAQYPTGGWPLCVPAAKAHERHISFHDYTMASIMVFLRDVFETKSFSAVSPKTRDAAKKAFEKGIGCIVKCQIDMKGDLTGWCSRHDEKTLEPRPGRDTEPVSISAKETSMLLGILMSLENPEDSVIGAVHAGCAWIDHVKLRGIRLQERDGDLHIVRDDDAPPLWARYYQIGTNRPLFAKGDGTLKYKMSELDRPTRLAVDWYAPWGRPALELYAKWKDRFQR